MHKRPLTKTIAIIGITAAIYTALTLGLYFISYKDFQCRVSEVMNLLAFFNPIFAPGVILGCFISNLFSPYSALMDCLFGVPATALSLFCISKCKNLFVASLFPVVINGIMIGLEILIASGQPYRLSAFLTYSGTVAAGEFLAVSVIGYLLFKLFLMKNERFMALIKGL